MHVKRVEQSKETAKVSLGSAVRINDAPKVVTIPAEGKGKSCDKHQNEQQLSSVKDVSTTNNFNNNKIGTFFNDAGQTTNQVSNQSPLMQGANEK